jgi:predicted transcriptional regulator
MTDFTEYENRVLDFFRGKNIRASESIGENLLIGISPAQRRADAVESLIQKGLIQRKRDRLFVTEQGEAVMYS